MSQCLWVRNWCGLAGSLWLSVSRMSVVKVLARFALLSRLNWGPCVGVFVGVN